MGGGKGLGTKAALAAIAALALAASLAGPAEAAQYTAALDISGPGGHGLFISGTGHRISASATSDRRSLSGDYQGPGRVSKDVLSGRLGRFGSVALRFHPEGKPERTRRPAQCSGSPRVFETWTGTYSGSIRFSPDAGLRGYTGEGSWKGSLSTVLRWRCKGREFKPEFDPQAGGINVFAASCGGPQFQATVEVEPAEPPPPPGDGGRATAQFFAAWSEKVGIATVTYAVSAEAGPRTATFTDDLGEGTLRPPPPFHGEATIRRQDEAWEWAGDLTAHFPNRTVPLTGPEFKPFVSTFEPRPHTAFLFGFSLRCR